MIKRSEKYNPQVQYFADLRDFTQQLQGFMKFILFKKKTQKTKNKFYRKYKLVAY